MNRMMTHFSNQNARLSSLSRPNTRITEGRCPSTPACPLSTRAVQTIKRSCRSSLVLSGDSRIIAEQCFAISPSAWPCTTLASSLATVTTLGSNARTGTTLVENRGPRYADSGDIVRTAEVSLIPTPSLRWRSWYASGTRTDLSKRLSNNFEGGHTTCTLDFVVQEVGD